MGVVKKNKADSGVKTNKKRGLYKSTQGRSLKSRTFFKKKTQSCPNAGQKEPGSTLPRPAVRYNEDYFDVLTKKTNNNEYSTPGPNGEEGRAIVMRPIKQEKVEETPERKPNTGEYEIDNDNMIVHKLSLMNMINEHTKKHILLGECENAGYIPEWDIVEIQPWGFFSSVKLKCNHCTYKSDRIKLYEEVDSDAPRPSAVGNLRVMMLTNFMPLGPTELFLICAGFGIRPASMTGMQDLAYRAGEIIKETASNDIRKWRQFVVDCLHNRGIENPRHIAGSIDTCYHGSNKASSVTAGTGANQATTTLIENVTGRNKIVGHKHVNQVCPSGSRLKAKGEKIYCGNGGEANHPGCTANEPLAKNISEYQMTLQMGKEMYEQDQLLTVHVCSDSDAQGKNALAEVLSEHEPEMDIQWSKDPYHNNKRQKFHLKDRKFSEGTFGPGLTVGQRQERAKAFAYDMSCRVGITLRNAKKYYKDNIEKLKEATVALQDYIIKCYGGNHKSCSRSSIAQLTGCKGPEQSQCWMKREGAPLQIFDIDSLELDSKDTAFVRQVMCTRIGEQSLDYFKFDYTTSINEAFNRTHWHCNPKTRTFARTSDARALAAVGKHNNNLPDFFQMTCAKAGCPIPADGVSHRTLRQYQRKRDLTQENQQTKSSKMKTSKLNSDRRKQYHILRQAETEKDRYLKYTLDEAIEIADHNRQNAVDRIADLNAQHSSNVQSIDPGTLDIEVCEKAIKKALKSSERSKVVIKEAQEECKQFAVKRKKVKANMRAAAKARVKAKSDRQTRSNHMNLDDHSYTKL